MSDSRRSIESVVPYLLSAALGAAVGYLLGDRIRMTVPHGCRGGCGPDYGISGVTAGAVWGALVAIFVLSVPRGWKPGVGAAGILVSGGSAANLTAIACAREALVGPMSSQIVAYTSDPTRTAGTSDTTTGRSGKITDTSQPSPTAWVTTWRPTPC